MPTIRVQVRGKIATNLTPEEKLVCGNEDYEVEFDFDESWAGVNFKTGLFIRNGELIAQPFDGNICAVPRIENTTLLAVGVKSSDGRLFTTTPAFVDCLKSASDLATNKIPAPTKDVYDEIIALINKYIGQGGGGSGGTDEERVREIVAEATAGLQPKADENLQTESKEIVGAINELYGREDKQGLSREQVEGIVDDKISTEIPAWAKEATKPSYTAQEVGALPSDTPLFSGDYNDLKNKPEIPSLEGVATEEYVDDKTDALSQDISIINTALEQSGLLKKYKQPITQEYNERITADGANVLDGSKAVLKKVVGSTVKCENLIPFPYSQTEKTGNGITFTVQYDGGVYVKGTATANVSFGIYSNCKLFSAYVGAFANGTPAVKDGYCMSATAILKSGNAPKVAHENYSSTPNNGFVYLLAENGKDYDCVVYPMINAGSTALPYEPYFEGLKSASFAGIESTGSNLFNAKAIKYADIKVNDDGSKILLPLATAGNGQWNTQTTLAELCPELKAGDIVYMHYIESVTSGNDFIYLSASSDLWYRNRVRTITEKDLASIVSLYGNRYISGYTEQVTLLNFRIVKVKDTPFAPYIEPTVFNFTETELGEWDEINFENQKVVKGGEEITQDTAFTEEQLVEYGEYILSVDGKTIRYKLATPAETPFTEQQSASGNEYTAYKGGTERVLGNDNAEFGAENTLTQDYILVTEVK